MEYFNIFPSIMGKTKIDSKSYDKENIIENVIVNYERQPQRNYWDSDSKLHHYHNNWDNDSLIKVNLNSLVPIYEDIIKKHMEQIRFVKLVKYKWSLTNLAINSRFMQEHDHFTRTQNSQCMFSCIHYIKFNKEMHSQTTFMNPLPIAHFGQNCAKINSLLNSDCTSNSTYCGSWNMCVEEDDFIIFPSYLKHAVYDSYTECKEHRIVSVVNIDLEY